MTWDRPHNAPRRCHRPFIPNHLHTHKITVCCTENNKGPRSTRQEQAEHHIRQPPSGLQLAPPSSFCATHHLFSCVCGAHYVGGSPREKLAFCSLQKRDRKRGGDGLCRRLPLEPLLSLRTLRSVRSTPWRMCSLFFALYHPLRPLKKGGPWIVC